MEKICILLEGYTHPYYYKTALGLILYGNYEIVALIDSSNRRKYSDEIFGIREKIPFVGSIKEALEIEKNISSLFMGISPPGGKLPEIMIPILKEAIENNLNIVSGLHDFIEEIDLLKGIVKRDNQIWDVRKIEKKHLISDMYHPKNKETKIFLTVGSDCSVGKMITTMELNKYMLAHNKKTTVAATGQTGIMITRHGIPVDAVISDYVIGTLSKYISDLSKNYEYIFVEGQGGITHRDVSLGILYASEPNYLILCHQLTRKKVKGYKDWDIVSLGELVKIYEYASSWNRKDLRGAKVIGVSLDTHLLTEEDARREIEAIEKELNIPVTDPLRFGVEKLLLNIS